MRRQTAVAIKKPDPLLSPNPTGSGDAIQSALSEIYGLLTLVTPVCLVEFIGENLLWRTAIGAFANKGLKMFMALKARAMLGCCHGRLLVSRVT